MATEPALKRAVAFIDGQNLFHAARAAFGYNLPNYDAHALAASVCQRHGWAVVETRFYTGMPDEADNPFWHSYWSRKLSVMGKAGISVFSRPLRYQNKRVALPDGTEHYYVVGVEKGIKVASAFPFSAVCRSRRGIDRTDWIRVERAAYDACLDRRDYAAALPGGRSG